MLQDGWQLPEGLQLLGPVKGSGIREPTYLLRRQDGQIVQVSELLHLVVSAVVPGRTAEQVAGVVSDAYGRTLTTDGLAHLVEERLQPLGLVEHAGATATSRAAESPPPLVAVPEGHPDAGEGGPPGRATVGCWRSGRPSWRPLSSALVLLYVAALRAEQPAHRTAAGADHTLPAAGALRPADHRCCPARARSRGSLPLRRGQPGRIGYGVYLVFPAFYTDVTDSYRLGRAGRVRTDLGGLYFNVWFLLASGVGLPVDGPRACSSSSSSSSSSRCSSSSSRPSGSTATTCSRTSPASPTCSPGSGRCMESLIPGRETDPRG